MIERTSRLYTFFDLGPADLCNIHKQLTSSKTDVGTFLYFTGVDTSNSASIAAHLQSLSNLITSKPQYWFGEKKSWKVPDLTYCCYNAFSKVDMRVTVHIPGRFENQIINNDGKLLNGISDDELDGLWLETFVSSIVRCLIDNDEEDSNKIGGLVEVRKQNPFPNKAILSSFLSGFESLFFDGPKLGCNIEIPQPTLVSNYLVDGFMKAIEITQLYDKGLEILNRLFKKEPSVISLISQLYLWKDEEIKAVQTMNEGIQLNERDSDLLLLQSQFCIDKKKYEIALHLAKQAVKASPADFKTWSMLVKVYTKLNDFENALLTLNSCPMNSHKEKFVLKRVVPLKNANDELHLPSPVDVVLSEVSNLLSNDISYEQRNLDPQLANLPAANLKSTFAKAYDLLTDIVVKTGWESLLKYRAKVFVMEEEYRKDKSNSNGAVNKNGDADKSETEKADNTLNVESEEDNTSTIAVKSPKQEAGEPADSEATVDGDYESEFRKKRLCERWLDNLFMLLYEDLRAYTMWQAEFVHFQAQQMEYKKTTLEWEILGSIAFRLKHFKEGAVAFSNALSGRFSSKSTREMLKYYQMERSKVLSKTLTQSLANLNSQQSHSNYLRQVKQLNSKILENCVKLLVWNHRWYCDFLPSILNYLNSLSAQVGLINIQFLVYSNVLHTSSDEHGNGAVVRQGIEEMMQDIYQFQKLFDIEGCDN